MTKNKRRKEKLFEIYSENLSWVKEHPSIEFRPDFELGYICPLCLNLFSKESLHESDINPLTFDHNPPKSLAGKNGVLTCKKCNSKAGHDIDNQLLIRLEELDFLEFSPNSKTRTVLENKKNKVTAEISINENGSFRFNLDRKNSNPHHFDNFLASKTYNYKAFDPFLSGHDIFESGWTEHLNFNIDFPEKSHERYAEIALLKIAYLYAFQKFGHGFLINSSLYKIREQILNPEKEILPKVFWLKYNFPEKAIGLNIISEPKELRCFLIIFNLFTKSKKRQFAIALPGTSEPNLKIYENIETILCQDKEGSSNLNIEHLSDKEYATEKKWAFASHYLWQTLAMK